MRQRSSENDNRTSVPKRRLSAAIETNQGNILPEGPGDDRNCESSPEKIYPHGVTLFVLTVALMISTFMVALDTNVIGMQLQPPFTFPTTG